MSRSLRMRIEARQCSTMVPGSVPKDWMMPLRVPPSIRVCTARENASPRLGSKSDSLPFFTSDSCHSLFALSMSWIGLSRYAAEASAWVAAVWPAEPWSGTCGPGKKSKWLFRRHCRPHRRTRRSAARSRLPCPAHLLSWDHSVSGSQAARQGTSECRPPQEIAVGGS